MASLHLMTSKSGLNSPRSVSSEARTGILDSDPNSTLNSTLNAKFRRPLHRAAIFSLLCLTWTFARNYYGYGTSSTRYRATTPPSTFSVDPAQGWKDDLWPLRPSEPWDISTDFSHPRKLTYNVTSGTWMRLDMSPTGDLVFDMLGYHSCCFRMIETEPNL